MAKQTFTVGQVLTAAQVTSLQQTAMGGGSTTAKTASYVLVAADAGTVVQMNAAGATTITVNTALFAAGDTVQIQNVGAGVCTVTAGTATVNTSSTLALKQYDSGDLYFNSTSAALFFTSDAADSTTLLTTKGDLYGFSTLDARIPIGTNNQVLTADSAQALGLKWATPAGASGSFTKISTTTFSSVATQDIDSVFNSTYNSYFVAISNIYATTAADDLQLQMRVGATTAATTYYGAMDAVNYTGASAITGTNSGTECLLSANIGTSSTGTAAFFYVNFTAGGGSSCRPAIIGQSFDSNAAAFNTFGYERSIAAVYTGFRLKSSSTNITGTVVVYGLEK